MLNTTEGYTVDFDTVVFENEKYDAATTYKKTTGYQPAVAAIGRQVVFVEGRGGVISTTTMRIKKFLFNFMLLPSKWIRTGRQRVLKIFTSRTCYQPLFE